MTRPIFTNALVAAVLAAATVAAGVGRSDGAGVAVTSAADSQPPAIAREFRGVWVSPLDAMTGADWPSRMGMSPGDQRAELRILLDHARSIGLNAIVLHVRVAGDALYPSHLVPWSFFLSGTSGVGPKPEYDPLAFAVAEAHARGMQLHAWFNPFRAMLPGSTV